MVGARALEVGMPSPWITHLLPGVTTCSAHTIVRTNTTSISTNSTLSQQTLGK